MSDSASSIPEQWDLSKLTWADVRKHWQATYLVDPEKLPIRVIAPALGNAPRQFSQGAALEFEYEGKTHRIAFSDGLYRLLPLLDTPLRSVFRTWQYQSPSQETLDEILRAAYKELVKDEMFHDNVLLQMRMLPPAYRVTFLRHVDLLEDVPTEVELSKIDRTFDLLSDDFIQMCDDLIAVTVNCPYLYDYFVRPRSTSLDIEELQLVAEGILSMSPESRAFMNEVLRRGTELFEQCCSTAVDATFDSFTQSEFSINRIFGSVLPFHGIISTPPSPLDSIRSSQDVEPQLAISRETAKDVNAHLAAYVVKCLEISEAANSVLDRLFLLAEYAVNQNGGMENASSSAILGAFVQIEAAVSEDIVHLIGFDVANYSWVDPHDPLKVQNPRTDGTQYLAGKLINGESALAADFGRRFGPS